MYTSHAGADVGEHGVCALIQGQHLGGGGALVQVDHPHMWFGLVVPQLAADFLHPWKVHAGSL